MAIRVIQAFLKTAICSGRMPKTPPHLRNALKQKWGAEILKIFGYQLKMIGSPHPQARILVGNHISFLDIPALLVTAPHSTFIAKDDLERWPIIGDGARAGGTIFVSRAPGSDRSHTRNQVKKILAENPEAQIVVFPSGTTSLDENKRWKKGIFEIAQELELPVQLFHLRYMPARESAYIDDDQLVRKMRSILKIKNKTVTLTWHEMFSQIEDASAFAEFLREKVRPPAMSALPFDTNPGPPLLLE
jgi:1-acyl-sn-glycerol-3-phosphate acyltransferase